MKQRRLVSLSTLTVGLALAGCGSGSDTGRQPSADELKQAQQKQLADIDNRTDLTPSQREGLRHHYGGTSPNDHGADKSR